MLILACLTSYWSSGLIYVGGECAADESDSEDEELATKRIIQQVECVLSSLTCVWRTVNVF